jgi:hypothetical protein
MKVYHILAAALAVVGSTIIYFNTTPPMSSGEAALLIMQEAETHKLTFDEDGNCHGDTFACGRVGLIRLKYNADRSMGVSK